jgi:excinuclease ABC subunit B
VTRAMVVNEETDDYYETRSASEMTRKERLAYIKKLETEMHESARNLEFEKAALLRDRILELKV